MSDEKLRISAVDLTLGELAELEAECGGSLEQIMGASQARGIAGIAWLLRRRTEPAFTFADALNLRMSDLELIADGENPLEQNGDAPRSSLESGP